MHDWFSIALLQMTMNFPAKATHVGFLPVFMHQESGHGLDPGLTRLHSGLGQRWVSSEAQGPLLSSCGIDRTHFLEAVGLVVACFFEFSWRIPSLEHF